MYVNRQIKCSNCCKFVGEYSYKCSFKEGQSGISSQTAQVSKIIEYIVTVP